MEEVHSWLAETKLDMFEDVFIKNGYDELDVIAEIDETDLDAMKINLPGHRKKILLRVRQLQRLEQQADSREGPVSKKKRTDDLQGTPEPSALIKESTENEEKDSKTSSTDPCTQVPNEIKEESQDTPLLADEEDDGSEEKEGDPSSEKTSPFSSWFGKNNKRRDLPFYPRAGQKGVKIYSQHELGKVKGLEKLRRSFWNAKAEELCKDPTYLKWSVKEIHGVIDTSWTLKKTAILRNEAERVEAAAARSDKKIKQHKSTVTHNVKRMLHSHSEILSLDASLKQIKSLSKSSSSKKIKALEKRMTAEMTELKAAQESLRKSIEVKKAQLGVTDSYKYEEQSIDTNLFTSEEIEAMVNEIIGDSDQRVK